MNVRTAGERREGASLSRAELGDRARTWLQHHRLSAADSLSRVLENLFSSVLTCLVIGIALALPVGLSLAEIRDLGLNLSSSHLLTWAWLRRAPKYLQRRFEHRAGNIPASLQRLAETSGRQLHHGVERIGLLCYDRGAGSEIVFTNDQEHFPLEDATRGSAAIARGASSASGTMSGVVNLSLLLSPRYHRTWLTG